MDTISIRYGEGVTLPLETGDTSAVSADIYIGKPGETYILTKHTDLVDGNGTFVFSPAQTEKPLGTYYYQINIIDDLGTLRKYPSPSDGCAGCDEFPKFIINEALDVNEVS